MPHLLHVPVPYRGIAARKAAGEAPGGRAASDRCALHVDQCEKVGVPGDIVNLTKMGSKTASRQNGPLIRFPVRL
jgi:hypothetical protein